MSHTYGSPINLADTTKNSKAVQRGLKEWESANPAEIIECMERRGEVKTLKASAYDKAYKPRFSINERVPDATEGHGFRVGDRVKLSDTPHARLTASLSGTPSQGRVTGIVGPLVRVGSIVYRPDMWVKR